MKILFFTTAHNSLSQRAFVELTDRGHTVIVVIASNEAVMIEAVEHEPPDLIVAPMLKTAIPASIWQKHTCIIVHPGIKGDFIDDAFEEDVASFRHHIRQLAEELASSYRYEHLLEEKRHTRKTDEASKPLQAYREEELQEMWLNFFGADRSYHLARKHFVYKGLIPSAALQMANRS